MGYIVFARKWRPRTFDEVVGQEHIVGTLCRSIEKDRVAHAYIFTGTRGVGKTTIARILARALNCEKGPTAKPCGECAACKEILSGQGFDVMEIDGASNNSVNDIRDLRDNIGYSTMAAKHRVVIIDEVHMLTTAAFNAFLKTLEEPPPGVIFILATTDPEKIPATIQSRCQRYDFRRVSTERIAAHLAKICEAEKVMFEKAALITVARKAEGSVRDSLSLLDQVCSFCGDNLSEKGVREVLGLVGTDVYRGLMKNIRERNQAPALEAVQKTLFDGYDLHEFIMGLQEHIRNLLFAKIPGALEARGIDIEAEEAAVFADEAKNYAEPDLLRMSEIVKKTQYELKRSASPQFLVETMVLKLVYLDTSANVEQLLKFAAEGGGTVGLSIPATAENVKKKPESPIAAAQPLYNKVSTPIEAVSSVIDIGTIADDSAENTADTNDNVPKSDPNLQAVMELFDGKLL